MLKGFEATCQVQGYWQVCEDTYLADPEVALHKTIHGELVVLFSGILEYQARAICILSKSQLSRTWEKATGWHDWSGKSSDIDSGNQKCREYIPTLERNESMNKWNVQLDKMDQSRTILDDIRQVLRESNIQSQRHYENKAKKELLHDLVSDYESDKDFNKDRVAQTCEWFFKHPRFLGWRDTGDSPLLWVTAGPGCGKSVLSKCLINEGRLATNVTTSTVCYFFFKDGATGRASAAAALSAILHQLFYHDSTGKLIGLALDVHKSFGPKLKTNLKQLWRILMDCVGASHGQDIICVLDALDECDDREEFIPMLKEVHSAQGWQDGVSKFKFLITSRPYDGIEAAFAKLPASTGYLKFDGDESLDEISKDIDLVIQDKLVNLTGGLDDEDREMIAEMKSMRNRTYLWLHLAFGIIESKRSKYGKRANILRLLDDLPSEVSSAYEKILSQS
jgi:hypothetical protein